MNCTDSDDLFAHFVFPFDAGQTISCNCNSMVLQDLNEITLIDDARVLAARFIDRKAGFVAVGATR